MSRLPEFAQAEKEIAQLSAIWESDIRTKREALLALKNKFEAEKVLLPENMQREKQAEIEKKEKALIDLQTKLFGYDGDLFRKRQELVRPIQESIYKATQKVAKKHKLNMVLDRSRDLHFAYVDPTYNFTDFVLEELGIIDRQISIER